MFIAHFANSNPTSCHDWFNMCSISLVFKEPTVLSDVNMLSIWYQECNEIHVNINPTFILQYISMFNQSQSFVLDEKEKCNGCRTQCCGKWIPSSRSNYSKFADAKHTPKTKKQKAPQNERKRKQHIALICGFLWIGFIKYKYIVNLNKSIYKFSAGKSVHIDPNLL